MLPDTLATHAGRGDLADLGVHAAPIDLSTTYPVVGQLAAADDPTTFAAGGVVARNPIYEISPLRSVLTGFRAEVDLEQLGRVLTLPEAVEVFHVAGGDDFLLRVAVRDAEHLQHLLLDAFTSRAEVVQLHTSLVFEHRAKRVLEPLPARRRN